MNTVHVTNPEHLYRHIEVDATVAVAEQVAAGRLALASMLGVPPENYTSLFLLNRAMGQAHIPGSSQTVIVERDGLTSPLDFGVHVVDLIGKYPFLRGNPQRAIGQSPLDSCITAKTFDAWVGNHLFDDYPHLFGVTKNEAHGFRGAINSRWARGDSLCVDGVPMPFKDFCSSLGLRWDF